MARRAQIVIDVKDLDVYDQLINEIKAKGYDVDENTTTIEIHALAGYEPTVCKDLYALKDRLNNYIIVNGNKRVTKTELCKIARISRPSLNRWIKMWVISWDYFGSSFDLLQQWLLIFQGERPDDNNKLIECEFFGDSITKFFDTIKGEITFTPITTRRCYGCPLHQEVSGITLLNIEQIKECEKRHKERYVVPFWSSFCSAILAARNEIDDLKSLYCEKFRGCRRGSISLPATMNLMAFSQQIKGIADRREVRAVVSEPMRRTVDSLFR